jgi:L-lactate dehydrogenase complex protein LldG
VVEDTVIMSTETNTSPARDQILQRIRAALADVPENEAPEAVPVPRNYQRVDPSPRENLIGRFLERVAEYKATVRRVGHEDLPSAIATACAARSVRRLVVPKDLPDAWLPEGVAIVRDESLTNEQIETTDGVLTGCAFGIAQTGTIVLDGGRNQGRRALTLLPDYHLCVIRDDQIVGLVPEAVAALADAVRVGRRPLTWISGPSATSDIELNRVEGVHGPRTLEVLVVLGANDVHAETRRTMDQEIGPEVR